jgi:hypothetical protein
MSSASFGTVNATGLNVTGVLQASEIRTTRPMQVSNLTSTGLATLTNVAISGSVRGDLNVTGNIVAQGYVLGTNAIDTQNTTDRLAVNTNEVYGKSEYATLNGDSAQFFVKPINAIQFVPIKNDDGTPANVLTQNTPWNDPVALDAYGHEAPLVKIADNGTLSYINVATTSITDICSNLIPAAMSNVTQSIRAYTTDITLLNLSNMPFGMSNIMDQFTQQIAWQVKRGFPLPGKNGVKGYDTSHVFYQDCTYNNNVIAQFLTDNMSMGLDINPYLNGTGTVDLYLAGGIQRPLALAIPVPGLDWSNTYAISPFTVPVTTNGAEYQQKTSSNLNVVYLNTALNILNFNIVDFGSYQYVFPDGSSNALSGNVYTCSPKTFTGSFGFYRSAPTTATTAYGFDVVDPEVITYIESANPSSGTTQSSLAAAEYMIQMSNTMTFTFQMSDLPGTTTITNPRTFTAFDRGYNINRDVFSAWCLPRYDYVAGTNFSITHFRPQTLVDYEITGFDFTNGPHVGANENAPYITTRRATSSSTHSALLNFYARCVADRTHGPEEMVTIPVVSQKTYCASLTIFHEYMHSIQFGIGVSARSFENMIYDDEWLASTINLGMTLENHFKDTKLIGVSYLPALVHMLSRGQWLPFARTFFDAEKVGLSGTNLELQAPTNQGAFFSAKYALAHATGAIGQSYDPNYQHIKLYQVNIANKLGAIPKAVYEAIAVESRNQSDINNFRSINPGLSIQPWVDAVEDTHMHYSDGTLVTNAADLWEENVMQLILSRNNAAVPDKYKNNDPVWYISSYTPTGVQSGLRDSPFTNLGTNMWCWDFIQTNEDTFGAANVSKIDTECVMPWWPKNITGVFPDGKDSYGRTFTNPLTGNVQPYTQDCSYKAMSNVSLTTYTSNVVRHVYSFQPIAYALPSALSNVTVQLQEPTLGGSYDDGYNSNVSVCVFKYIPDRCVSNVLSNAAAFPTAATGAFMMQGPFTLSKTGTTSHTFDLTALITDGVNGTFSTNSSNLVDGTIAFSNVFQYGIDDGTKYNPAQSTKTYATSLGMLTGYYQPVTRLLIVDKHSSAINWSDGDIQSKLFVDQLKPSSFKISVNGQP